MMSVQDFAAKVKAKYPEYASLDDTDLTKKVLAKYPEYNDVVQVPDEGPSKLGSFARGAMSGIPGAEAAVSGIQSLDPNTTYAQAHQKLEDEKNQDWETNPVSYGAGKTAGIVGSALAAPATETLGGAAAVGAGIGALSGADTAATPSDIPSDVLKGGATGTALGALGHGVSSALEAAPTVAKRGLAALGKDTSVEDIERYLANPDVINSAGSKEDIADTLAGATNDITKASGQLSQEARSTLDASNNVLGNSGSGLSDIQAIINGAKQDYLRDGVVKTGSEPAIKALDNEMARITSIAQANGGNISETTLRGIIDDLQDAVKTKSFGNPEVNAQQDALRSLSGRLNDTLRSANPQYAEAMQPSAEAANLSSNLQDTFKLDNGQPTDQTASKLSNVLKEGKPETQNLADQLKNMTGTDIANQLQNTQTKENLNAPGSGEAMKAVLATLGFGAGKMTGVPYGGIAGAAAGRFSANAVNGGSLAKTLMNMYLGGSESFGNSALKPLMAKYGPVLINAAKVGGNQLAATHFVLATSNPEYQQLVDHAQNNMPDSDQVNTGIHTQE